MLLRIFAVLNVILCLLTICLHVFLPKLIARNVSVMIDTNYYRHTVENYFSNRQMLHCNWYLYNFVCYQNILFNDRYFFAIPREITYHPIFLLLSINTALIRENKWHVIPFQITLYSIYLILHHRFLIHASYITTNMQYASIWLRSLTRYVAEIFILVQIPISSKTFNNTHTQCITTTTCALIRQIISITAVHCKDVQVSYKLTLSQYISRCT